MTTALEVTDLSVAYGKMEVLRGISLKLAAGSSLALFGHNGAGKSTLLKAVFGLVPATRGRVCINGVELTGARQDVLIRAGVAYVPQNDAVFRDLTVEENVAASLLAVQATRTVDADRAYALFPPLGALRRRRAGLLSGGERRLLAVAMAAIRSPRVLLLDEPSIGLSPSRTEELFRLVDGWREEEGCSIVMAEQNVVAALRWMQRALVIRAGRTHWEGSTAELREVGEVGIARLL